MNPGGDYGKKELSPALRNRFTEIWVPPVGDISELRSIAQQRYLNLESLAEDDFSICHFSNYSVNYLLCRISDSDHFWLVDVMLRFWKVYSALHMHCDDITSLGHVNGFLFIFLGQKSFV